MRRVGASNARWGRKNRMTAVSGEETLVVAHHELALDLLHSLERNTGDDEDGDTAEPDRDVEQIAHERWKHRNQRKVQRPRKRDAIENVLEVLDCIWLDEDAPGLADDERAQKVTLPAGFSHAMYGAGGMTPRKAEHRRGIGKDVTPFFQYRGTDIRAALEAMQSAGECDAHEGTALDFVNPVNGEPLFATLGYGAQLLAKGEETAFKRETASTVYVCIEGRGQTEVAGQTFNWEENDIFVVPNFLWRRHINTGLGNAILYTMTDRPLLEKIGQYRAQGMGDGGEVEQLVV